MGLVTTTGYSIRACRRQLPLHLHSQQKWAKSHELRNQTERDIASDNQHETALQDYIDKLSELLLHEKLRKSAPEDEVCKIAHVRTLTVLPRLDKERKRSVLQFLHESGLIDKDKRIIDLRGADLSGANLIAAYLNEADLSRAILSEADLSGAYLDEANLGGAYLRGAILRGSYLHGANLRGANLHEANWTKPTWVKPTWVKLT